MSKIREMVDSNTIIGEPIQTPDGVTPVSYTHLDVYKRQDGGGRGAAAH